MDKKGNQNELIYGRNPIREALNNNKLIRVFATNSFSDGELLNKIKERNIPIVIRHQNELSQMVDGVHQGIVGEVKRYEYSSFEEILRISKNKKNPLIVILDEINDPHNLGAIMRSCDVFGASGIIVKKHHQALLNSTVAKTSAGAINYVKIAQVPNLVQAIKTLKENGFWVVSADGSGNTNYQDLDYDFPVVLVIGNEGSGISPLIVKNSDYVVRIPMEGKINSLNASVASAVLMSRIALFHK